jgi:hypothetical protein
MKTMQWEANINYYKKCALKRKNVRTTNWKQCNEQRTTAIVRHAEKCTCHFMASFHWKDAPKETPLGLKSWGSLPKGLGFT